MILLVNSTSSEFLVFNNVTYSNYFSNICGTISTSAYYRSGLTSITDMTHLIFVNYTGIKLPNGDYSFYFGDAQLISNNQTYGVHLKVNNNQVKINYDDLPSNWGYNDNYHFYLGIILLAVSIAIFSLMWYRYRIKVNKFRQDKSRMQKMRSKKVIYNEKFN